MNKKIMHFRNICRVPTYLAKAQREHLGDMSKVFAYDDNPYDIGADILVPMTPVDARGYTYLFLEFRHMSKKAEIIHFHIRSVLPKCQDLIYWNRLTRKKIIVHHHGSEIRNVGEFPMVEKHADAIVVSTPDLLQWSKRAVWVPNAVDVSNFDTVGVVDKRPGEEIKVVHAPINRELKGTDYVFSAITELKSEGCNISLTCVEGRSPSAALEIYKTADIVVDQVIPRIGSYGMFSIESMLLGKPVICSINPDFKEKYFQGLPILNCDIETLKNTLKILYDSFSKRASLGQKGRSYAERVHGSYRVAEQINEIYEGI